MNVMDLLVHRPVRASGRPAGYAELAWVAAAAVLGFIVAALFAGALHLPRALYLIPYLIAVGIFLVAYAQWSGIDVSAAVRRHPAASVIATVVASVFVVANVWAQRASPTPRGLSLVFDLLWLGVVYGMADALLLTVVPVFAVWNTFAAHGWTRNLTGRIAAGATGWIVSALVTVVYHLGYPEFRGPQVIAPVIGNGVITLAYLLTMNPLVAVIAHIAMHVAAVLHGVDTALQLPPH